MENYRLLNDFTYIKEESYVDIANEKISTKKDEIIISDFKGLIKFILKDFKYEDLDFNDLYFTVVYDLKSLLDKEIDEIEINEDIIKEISIIINDYLGE